jgi:formate-dependent nitrite reductase membrane component NrfD
MSAAIRYAKTVDPIHTDGRDIDIDVAELVGEAAGQQASGKAGEHIQSMAQPWRQILKPKRTDPTYYDRPMLNKPIWEWAIPTYYYVGGLTGASLVLGAAAQVIDGPANEELIAHCHLVGFAGAVVSGALLTYDLGRPERFLNMLRVFRPTSPMNMGAWILTGAGAMVTGAFLLRKRRGWLGTVGYVCGYAAGFFGAALATYTGVLISNTAIPLWQESRRVMPLLFGASAVTSVGSLFELLPENPKGRRITKAFGIAGEVAELTASALVEQQVSAVPRVARPLRRGWSGFLWKAALGCTAISLLAGTAPKQTRNRQLAAGLLGTIGSLLMRFAMERAGSVSASDPRASFHLQRAETSVSV